MEAYFSSETLVTTYRTTQCRNYEDHKFKSSYFIKILLHMVLGTLTDINVEDGRFRTHTEFL
jgi:hypothetical protein